MFNQLIEKVNTPEFKARAIRFGGRLVSLVTTVIIANAVNEGIEKGVEALIEKLATPNPAE